jgi:hypothetical protein
MIDQRFIEDLAQDLVIAREPEPVPEIQLASANTGVTTDGGAFVGTRLNMPKGLNTRENQAKQSVLIADTLAGGGKGAVQGFVGLPGDLESIGRMALGYLGYNVDENTVLPTSEEIGKRLESALGPVIPQGQTTGVPTEERVRAAEGGELGGELLAPSGQIKLAGKVIKATKDLPVGMSIKAVDESLDPLGFYSAASKAVDNIQQPKGTGAQFLAQIEKTPGVKKEELLWTGLDEFLAGKKSVTKAEVQDYLNTNRVEVKEIQLGGSKSEYPYRTADEWQEAIFKAERAKNFDEAERITAAWEEFELGGEAKFAKFTLPGGENYREIYLTLPVKKLTEEEARVVLGAKPDANLSEADIDYASKKNQYIVPRAHSASPEADFNRLAQIRVNDRVDADGKKVLFVEEIQSDWHQAGRKKGYKGDINEAAKEYTSILKEYGDKLATEMPAEVRARLDELRPIVSKNATEAVPDAPFKTSWHELALKRAIQLASEGGYDRIAFTTGKTQAERYDLSKEIQDITITRGEFDFAVQATDKNGKPAIYKTIPDLRNLDELVGKDLAEKVKDDFANKSGNEHNYSGLDLQVGGEGMKGFYDTILPKYLDKYGKKWDAKTGMTEIPTEKTRDASGMPSMYPDKASVHYMDITPKMKESVLTKGQPLFQMAPAIPAGVAAGQQEDNK